jgi:hypothetical protein
MSSRLRRSHIVVSALAVIHPEDVGSRSEPIDAGLFSNTDVDIDIGLAWLYARNAMGDTTSR